MFLVAGKETVSPTTNKSDDEEDLIFDHTSLLNKDARMKDLSKGCCPTGGKLQIARTVNLCLSFFGLGLCFAIPTATLDDLRKSVQADENIKNIYTARYSGYLFGALIGGFLFDRYNRQFLLFLSLLATGVGILVMPFCQEIAALMACTAVTGITMGFLDTGGNVWCLDLWGRRSAPIMQTLHFCFGLGAFVAPIVAEPFLSPYSHHLPITNFSNETLDNTTYMFRPGPRVGLPHPSLPKHVIVKHSADIDPFFNVYEADDEIVLTRIKRVSGANETEWFPNPLENLTTSEPNVTSSEPNVTNNAIINATEIQFTVSMTNTTLSTTTTVKPKPKYADGNQLKIKDKWDRLGVHNNPAIPSNQSKLVTTLKPVTVTTLTLNETTLSSNLTIESFAKNMSTSESDGISNETISSEDLSAENFTSNSYINSTSTENLLVETTSAEKSDVETTENYSSIKLGLVNTTESVSESNPALNDTFKTTENNSKVTLRSATITTTASPNSGLVHWTSMSQVSEETPTTQPNASPDSDLSPLVIKSDISTKKSTEIESSSIPTINKSNLLSTENAKFTSTENPSVTTQLTEAPIPSTHQTVGIDATTSNTPIKDSYKPIPDVSSTVITPMLSYNIIPYTTKKKILKNDTPKLSNTIFNTVYDNENKNPEDSEKVRQTAPFKEDFPNQSNIKAWSSTTARPEPALLLKINKPENEQPNTDKNVKELSTVLPNSNPVLINSEQISTGETVVTEKPLQKERVNDFFNYFFELLHKNRLGKFEIPYILLSVYIFAVASVFLVFLCKNPREPRSRQLEELSRSRDVSLSFRVVMVGLMALFLCLYVGIEVGVGELLESFATKETLQLSQARGYFLPYLFWGSFAAARGFSIFISTRFTGRCMLLSNLTVCLVASVMLVAGADKLEALLWVGVVVLGAGMAPLFPTSISWLEHYLHITNKTASIFVLGAAIGELIIPIIIDTFINQEPMVLMYVNIIVNALCFISFIILCMMASKHSEKYQNNKPKRSMYQLASTDDYEDVTELVSNTDHTSNGYHLPVKRKLPPIT